MTRGRRLAGRVAVVTGASSGIGRAIALGYAGEGARVALLARREERLRETTAAIAQQGGEALGLRCDVTAEGEVGAARDRILEAWGRADILVNAAGVLHAPAPLHTIGPDAFDRVVAVNLRGPYLMCRAFVPSMLAQQYGRIINVTSGYKHQPLYGPYSITKSALDAMTLVLAQELAGTGVLAEVLDPGYVRTEMAPEATTPPESVLPSALDLATR